MLKVKKCCDKREKLEKEDSFDGIDYIEEWEYVNGERKTFYEFRVFYDGGYTCLSDIKFCPYCGHKLETIEYKTP